MLDWSLLDRGFQISAGWRPYSPRPAIKSRALAAFRFSDRSLQRCVALLGLLVFHARGDRFFYVVLTAFVMISAIMVSYTRARAESLIGSCRVGFMERPERLVLVIIGALFNRMGPVLWVSAVLSTITVIHRMRYTWTRTELVDRAARPSHAA